MANRRMFSNKIIMSAKFLKMPASSQALYFHLGLNADDDGVVEAFSIMRIIGSAADDLKILIAKGFIIQLNEDEVCFIVDWLEHNQIRPDRKVNSIYHNLLVQTIGNIKLIEAKPRADRQPKGSNGTSQGQLMGGIGKDSIGKDSIGKDKTNATKVADVVEFDFNGFSEEEIESIKDWIQYKKESKQTYKPTALKGLRAKLLNLKNKGQLVSSINNSIGNNWAGLFEDKTVTQTFANQEQKQNWDNDSFSEASRRKFAHLMGDNQ